MARKMAVLAGPVYKALVPLTVGDTTYLPGDVVVEAPSWRRVDAWVRGRKIELVEV